MESKKRSKKRWPVFPLVELKCPVCRRVIKGTAKTIDSEVEWVCGCEKRKT